jgi:hypothetical protein
MRRNPVKRGLASALELWKWSSYRTYTFEERGSVNMEWMFPPYVVRTTRYVVSECRTYMILP